MKKYCLKETIVLGFLDPQEQYDLILTPEDNATIESDGQTIWLVKNDQKQESITQAHVIERWLANGLIVEIT